MRTSGLGPLPTALRRSDAEQGDAAGDAPTLIRAAWESMERGDVAGAIGRANDSLAHVRDDTTMLAWARLVLGHAASLADDLAGAAAQLSQAFAEFDAHDDDGGRGRTLLEMARVSAEAGDVSAALDTIGPAVRILVTTGDDALPDAVLLVGRLAAELGDVETAARLIGYVQASGRSEAGEDVVEGMGRRRSTHDVDAWLADGRKLSGERAVSLALARCGLSR